MMQEIALAGTAGATKQILNVFRRAEDGLRRHFKRPNRRMESLNKIKYPADRFAFREPFYRVGLSRTTTSTRRTSYPAGAAGI